MLWEFWEAVPLCSAEPLPVVAKRRGPRWPVVSCGYCTDLTHQSEIKALSVANIKGLLLVRPVPRASFSAEHINKVWVTRRLITDHEGRDGCSWTSPGTRPVNIHTGTCHHQRQCSSGLLKCLKLSNFFFQLHSLTKKLEQRRLTKTRRMKLSWVICFCDKEVNVFLLILFFKAARFYFLLIDWQHVVDRHVDVLLFYR